MTVATQNNLASSPLRRGGTAARAGTGNPWRRLWQIPMLVLGLGAFGLGVRALVRTIRPVPFEKQIAGVQTLLAQEQFSKAIEQINILGNYYLEPQEQGELQVLAGDAMYLAQKNEPALVRENYEKVEQHYRNGVKLGLEPTVKVNQRWGEAALALGESDVAVDRLEAAIRGEPALVKLYSRQLTNAYTNAGMPEKALTIVEKALKEGAKSEGDENDLEAIEDQTWALCKRIEIALAMEDQAEHKVLEQRPMAEDAADNALDAAVDGARHALEVLKERDPVGRVLAWIGRAEVERGEMAKAERDLLEARNHFSVHHLDDGRAAVLLGRIAESRGAFAEAGKLFQEVVAGHAGTRIWAAARLGRAEVATQTGKATEEALADYRYVIQTLKDNEDETEKAPVGQEPELISRDGGHGVRASLVAAFGRALASALAGGAKGSPKAMPVVTDETMVKAGAENEPERGGYTDALKFLLVQQELAEPETVDMARRLATTREKLGDELMAEGMKDKDKPNAKIVSDARAMYAQAAEDYLRHAKLTTLNEAESANSLWKAADLFDRAGMMARAAAVYEQFTIQRPRDARVPDGLLSLGRLYESAGEIDKAVMIYQRNMKENPKTPAAYASAVNLARSYARQAEDPKKPVAAEQAEALREKAKQVLLSMVQDSTDLEPSAREFKESLVALSELYFQQGQWADAILRLQEIVERYPDDKVIPRTLFLLGQCYRKSAAELAEAVKDPGLARRSVFEKERMDRLLTAAGAFSRVIGLLDDEGRGEVVVATRDLSTLEETYLRSSYMNRAACFFERGEYEAAIKLYDQTASRFSDEAVAAEAYVQIVNAYMAEKEIAKARTAAERGTWILKRIPDAAFKKDAAGTDRAYYERLLAMSRN